MLRCIWLVILSEVPSLVLAHGTPHRTLCTVSTHYTLYSRRRLWIGPEIVVRSLCYWDMGVTDINIMLDPLDRQDCKHRDLWHHRRQFLVSSPVCGGEGGRVCVVDIKDNADPLQCTVQRYLAWAQWAAGPECPAHNPGLDVRGFNQSWNVLIIYHFTMDTWAEISGLEVDVHKVTWMRWNFCACLSSAASCMVLSLFLCSTSLRHSRFL